MLGALLFAGSLADGGTTSWPGLIARRRSAPLLGCVAVGGLFERARGAPRGRRRGAAHRLRRRRRAAARRARDLRAAGLDPRARGLRRAAARAAAGARARSTPACGSCGTVAERRRSSSSRSSTRSSPSMLDRAIEEGRAPALAALRERGTYVRDCVSTFPSVTPVAAAAIATGCGPGEHHIPSMNWYHRGEERYVEYGSSFPATRAFGVVRSLYDTVYNMNMAHLTPCAQDGLRAPRRRRPADRLHHLPDLPRPHPPRARPARASTAASPRRRQFRHAVYGAARALLRRPVRLAQHRLHLRARHARASATSTPAAWARTSSSTTCSTSCSSRCPTTTPTRTSAGPDAQVALDRGGRPRARAHHARGRRRRRVPRASTR